MYKIKTVVVLLCIVGLMFGCEGNDGAVDDLILMGLPEGIDDDEVADDGHGHDEAYEEEGVDFDEAASALGVVFDDPVAAGRPSPSFSADIAPILTNRCATPGCHVAGGPHDIDLRTYDSVMKGGDEGAIVIPGDARESEMVEEIVEGKMPPDGPPLEAAQTQSIIDWINDGAKNN